MTRITLVLLLCLSTAILQAQPDPSQEVSPDASGLRALSGEYFVSGKKNDATGVKDQERTSTCWSFSGTSLLESQALRNKKGVFDLSEMYTVRNIYLDKARNYILRQGATRFTEGALGHDVVQSIQRYGAMPELAYNGRPPGTQVYDHELLLKELRKYLDSTLKSAKPALTADWRPGFERILNKYMGAPPASFVYSGRKYTPKSFAEQALQFQATDYVNVTSFTHQPYDRPYVLEVPDNFSNGAYYNVPLADMINLVKDALNKGYTVMWDADVSNEGFRGKFGLALLVKDGSGIKNEDFTPELAEEAWNETIRQQRFENLTTQDDHLMHVVGIEKNKQGKTFFIVKNSWGAVGPYQGYVHVSESYFAMNTISLVFPKAALPAARLEKWGIR